MQFGYKVCLKSPVFGRFLSSSNVESWVLGWLLTLLLFAGAGEWAGRAGGWAAAWERPAEGTVRGPAAVTSRLAAWGIPSSTGDTQCVCITHTHWSSDKLYSSFALIIKALTNLNIISVTIVSVIFEYSFSELLNIFINADCSISPSACQISEHEIFLIYRNWSLQSSRFVYMHVTFFPACKPQNVGSLNILFEVEVLNACLGNFVHIIHTFHE